MLLTLEFKRTGLSYSLVLSNPFEARSKRSRCAALGFYSPILAHDAGSAVHLDQERPLERMPRLGERMPSNS
jgi:hypothetical protein